jgi:hypothetical protein
MRRGSITNFGPKYTVDFRELGTALIKSFGISLRPVGWAGSWRSGWPGKSEQVWPSGPAPSSSKSSRGGLPRLLVSWSVSENLGEGTKSRLFGMTEQ